MALQAKASKGGIVINDAYIIIISTKMEKYLRPTMDENKKFSGNVVDVQHSARVEIYPSKEQRDNDFGSTPFNAFFAFGHREGGDLISEAYSFIINNGIHGWVLEDIKEV